MFFAAVILGHPNPAMAQSDVDSALGALPSPGETQGIIIINNQPVGNEAGMEVGDGGDPDDETASKGIIIVNSKPGGNEAGMEIGDDEPDDLSSKGIIIIDAQPSPGTVSPGTTPAPDNQVIKLPQQNLMMKE